MSERGIQIDEGVPDWWLHRCSPGVAKYCKCRWSSADHWLSTARAAGTEHLHACIDLTRAVRSLVRSGLAAWGPAPPSGGASESRAKTGHCLQMVAAPRSAAASSSTACLDRPLAPLTRLGSCVPASRRAMDRTCLWLPSGRHPYKSVAADRCENLLLGRPRAAHRSPAWAWWMWSFERVMRTAQCVFPRRLQDRSRVSGGARLAPKIACARTLIMIV